MIRKERTLQAAGFYSSVLLAVSTLITFAIAVCTPPISGPSAQTVSVVYPYTDIASRFPRDYYWMFGAILVMLVFVVFMACVNLYASPDKKLFSQIGLIFASMSAFILIVNYYIQLSVIQPSVLNGELDGISILTQYNPHGLFIAAEEIGYLFTALSLLFIIPIFAGREHLHKVIRRTALGSFVLSILSLVVISAFYGVHREYRFEVAVICIEWLALILIGILTAVLFRRGMAKGGVEKHNPLL